MKLLLTSLLLIISILGFSQSDTVFLNDAKWVTIKINPPQKDTVDVLCLVSDTSVIRNSTLCDYPNGFYNVASVLALRCKAVRENNIWYGGITQGNITYTINAPHDNWDIIEYLLPKKYIVWQSVIITKPNQ